MSLSRRNEWAHRTRGDSALSLDETHPGHQEVRQRQARVGASSVRRDACSPAKSDVACREKGSEQPPEGRGKHPLGRAGLTVLQRCLPSRLQARQPGRGFSVSRLVQELRAEVKWGRVVQPSAAWCEEAGGGRPQGRKLGGTTQTTRGGPAAERQGDTRVLCLAGLDRQKRIFICSLSSHLPARNRTRPSSFLLFL